MALTSWAKDVIRKAARTLTHSSGVGVPGTERAVVCNRFLCVLKLYSVCAFFTQWKRRIRGIRAVK